MRPALRDESRAAPWFRNRVRREAAAAQAGTLEPVRIADLGPGVRAFHKAPDPAMALQPRPEGTAVAFFSTTAGFGITQDITVQALHTETFFPAATRSRTVLFALTGG